MTNACQGTRFGDTENARDTKLLINDKLNMRKASNIHSVRITSKTKGQLSTMRYGQLDALREIAMTSCASP